MPLEGKFGPMTKAEIGSKKRNLISNFLKEFNALKRVQARFARLVHFLIKALLTLTPSKTTWEIGELKLVGNDNEHEKGWHFSVIRNRGTKKWRIYHVEIVAGKIILKNPRKKQPIIRTWKSFNRFKTTILKEITNN